MASQTLIFSNPAFLSPHHHRFHSPKPLTLSFPNPTPKIPFLNLTKTRVTQSKVFASSSSSIITPKNPTPIPPLLNNSTRTITTIFALAQLVAKFVAHRLGHHLAAIQGLRMAGSVGSGGPMFFAAVSGGLNTPLTVVAAGMAKWLDIYSGVLLVRVLLSWFPNIPWDKQPLSAIRDLCDPYLNLFRNIIPPVMNTLDISPLFAFSVLGTLAAIMKHARL
ncbi:hypothetical protein LguiA_011788 [Lonicera macranthoides]